MATHLRKSPYGNLSRTIGSRCARSVRRRTEATLKENARIGASTEDGEELKVYEPFDHRGEEGQKLVSDFGAWLNLVKSAAGTGLFAMPQAFAFVGIIPGVIGTILMGALITCTTQFLVLVHYEMCVAQKKPSLAYGEVVYFAVKTGPQKLQRFSNCVICLVDVTLMACYIGIGSVYVVFISGAIQEIVDPEMTIKQSYYALMLYPLLLAVNLVKNMKIFVPLSLLGNVFLLVAAITGIIYALKDGINDSYEITGTKFHRYPRFVGIVFFSISSPGLILSIENSMKNPRNYTKPFGVHHMGVLLIILSHILVGLIGYLKWGDKAKGNFIRNHETHDIATIVALSMQALAIYFSFGLQCYMPIAILYNDYALPALQMGRCCGTPKFWDLFIRAALTLVLCILAATIPQLGLFIQLVGAFCIASLGVLIPVLLDILVHLGNFGKYKWRLWLAIFMFTVGLIAMLCAGVVSIIEIIRYFIRG